MGYCVKYVSKVDTAHPRFTSKVFASKGLGKGWLNRYDARLNKFQGENTREYYKTPSGQKLAMPTYFRNKLWTDEEREQLWLQKLNKQTRYVRGEKIDVSTTEGEQEYARAIEYRQKENVALGYPNEPWSLQKYKKKPQKIWIISKLLYTFAEKQHHNDKQRMENQKSAPELGRAPPKKRDSIKRNLDN